MVNYNNCPPKVVCNANIMLKLLHELLFYKNMLFRINEKKKKLNNLYISSVLKCVLH